MKIGVQFPSGLFYTFIGGKITKKEKVDEDKIIEWMDRLLNSDEFKGVKLSSAKTDAFLKIIKEKMPEITPEQFLYAGLQFLITRGIVYVSKEKLRKFIQKNINIDMPEIKAAAGALNAILKNIPTYENLFFVQLFIRDIKNHPLMNEHKMWKLIYPFLPSKKIETKNSKILIPEKKAEKTEKGVILTDTPKDSKKKEKIIIP